MSEFQLDGPELKKMLRYAKKNPLPFAFNPGKSANEHYFAMHRKRPAKALAKVAKEEGVGKKAAYGTCQIDGKVMKLFCVITIPSMAKALKKFLKANKISLNVEVLDPDGGLLEADIEDLPDDRDFANGDGAAAVGVIDGKQASATSAADLVARMKKAQALIGDAPSAVAGKLNPALKKILEAIKSQNLSAAGKGLSQVEAVLAKVAAAQSETMPAPDDMKPIKAQFAKLVPRAREVLDARPPAKRPLGGLVKSAGEALKGEDADEASRLVGLLADQIEVWESRSAAPNMEDLISPDILNKAKDMKPADVEVAQAEYEHASAGISKMPAAEQKAAAEFNKRFGATKSKVDKLVKEIESGQLDEVAQEAKLAELEQHRSEIMALVSMAQNALKEGASA